MTLRKINVFGDVFSIAKRVTSKNFLFLRFQFQPLQDVLDDACILN